MTPPVRFAAGLGVLAVGVVAGGATVLLHQRWWGLALGVVAGVAALLWLPRGWFRAALAAGWCLAVARATLTRPEGDYLIPSNDRGWTLLAASLGLLLITLATPPRRRAGAGDPGDQGSLT